MKTFAARLEAPAIALVVLAAAWLATAGAIGLLEPTETRYSEIAREMHASGDYLVPRLNAVPHFHKPPLAYWITALGFAALGENAWGARVPAALATVATLALLIPIARRRLAALAIPPGLAVWATGSMALVFFLGRSVATDPYLTASVTAFWALAPSPWALAALGLGFFAKGPVVFVSTALPVLVAALLARDRGHLKLLGPAWGWWLCAAIALPWYLLIVVRVPGLIGYLFENQLWQRYTTHVHHREGPPWYFLGVLLAGAAPWTAALVTGIARLWRRRGEREARLLLAWLIAPLAFFSFSGSKLPAYLLPCFPAAGLIVACGLANAGRGVRGVTAGLLAAVAIAGWTLGPAAFGHLIGGRGAPPTPLPLAAHIALVCLLYAATWTWRAKHSRAAALVAIGFTSLMVALVPYEGPLGSPRPLATVLMANRGSGEPVIEFARFNAGVPFYLRQPVRMLEVPRETEFDDPTHPSQAFVTRDSLVALAAAHSRVWLVGPRLQTEALADSLGLRYQQVVAQKHEALGYVTR